MMLRNGLWILLFYAVLAAGLVPATILLSRHGATPGLVLQVLLVIAATSVCLALRREPPRAVLGSLRSWCSGTPVGIATGFAIWGAASLMLMASGFVSWHWGAGGMDALRVGLLDCLAVAVIEELLFRGFPFQRLVAGIGAWPAQLLIAGYFTLTHSNGLATAGGLLSLAAANIFLASLLFGATYLRTRSLAIPIALHFALNFFQGPVLGFGVSGHTSGGWLVPVLDDAPQWWTGGSFGLEASVPGTLAIVAALAAITMHKEGTR